MSVPVSRLLSSIILCILSTLLLTFCGDEDKSTQDDSSDPATHGSTPGDLPLPDPQNGGSKPEHRFTPAKITAGLPFSFHLVWEGKPYLLSLDNCGNALLLHGQLPQEQYATTNIEGLDGEDLNNLVIINNNGSPTIPSSCQLKVTVGQGTDNEESTLIALKVKAGAITLSGASIINGDSVKLEGVEGVDSSQSSVVVISRGEAIMDAEHVRYALTAISHPLQDKIETGTFALYKPIVQISLARIDSLDPGNYLVIVANVSINGLSFEQVVPLQATAIKVSVSLPSLR